ncbi:D-aminoacyl-tRNA deacylase [Glycomyces algeriensis]|uniref:D-aminoacyl-tRNA deacylase n=1 Tax=Glycomyces algeriensis TaxID=256037 RepID=A0A9W6GDE6_9ACTN|nr:D-aminoacyl-tRNA deacylase [Glycomyces algeriensis]MDA1366438.1 D-aminoacyl-tRNA deacylase [Glycomyces algeriensis]MDR7352097.1 D-tyrosyl-tRNA(Tyr) deacylase [Glycomyces algeriensis]GLI44830.1 D-aminoacyl-tRNA deacylase [Glycomyces algeriensis]
MKAVVQTVSEAEVTVDGASVGSIGEGLLVLLGVTHTDGPAEVAWIAEKIWSLRILPDELSASDVDAPILLVSQFTLYADTRKGRRPSWNGAAPGPVAEPLVEAVAAHLRGLGAHVETGVFGAMMLVRSVNVGPNTILLER